MDWPWDNKLLPVIYRPQYNRILTSFSSPGSREVLGWLYPQWNCLLVSCAYYLSFTSKIWSDEVRVYMRGQSCTLYLWFVECNMEGSYDIQSDNACYRHVYNLINRFFWNRKAQQKPENSFDDFELTPPQVKANFNDEKRSTKCAVLLQNGME